jgi:hypothetical protein
MVGNIKEKTRIREFSKDIMKMPEKDKILRICQEYHENARKRQELGNLARLAGNCKENTRLVEFGKNSMKMQGKDKIWGIRPEW